MRLEAQFGPEVVQQGARFRVQAENGEFLRGVFHTRAQAEEHRLQFVARRVLDVLDPRRLPAPQHMLAHAAQLAGQNVLRDVPGYQPRKEA